MEIADSITEQVRRDIMKCYAAESGIDINDPDFWFKFNAYAQENSDNDSGPQVEICPCCGQEII